MGLVCKCISNEDKRNIYINLTDDGVYVKNKLEDIKNEALDAMLDGFDDNQREIFKDCVSKALVNIKKVL